MSTNTMKDLFKIKNIVGVKMLLQIYPEFMNQTTIGEDFNQLTGDDATTLAVVYGGHGSISVTSNIAPKLVLNL